MLLYHNAKVNTPDPLMKDSVYELREKVRKLRKKEKRYMTPWPSWAENKKLDVYTMPRESMANILEKMGCCAASYEKSFSRRFNAETAMENLSDMFSNETPKMKTSLQNLLDIFYKNDTDVLAEGGVNRRNTHDEIELVSFAGGHK